MSEGFCVAVLDSHGQGGRSEDVGGTKGGTMRGHIVRGLDDPDPKKLLFRAHFLDTAQLARIVMSFPEVDPGRVAAFGGSQGGGLDPGVARRWSPGSSGPHFSFRSSATYQRVSGGPDLARDAYEELRLYFQAPSSPPRAGEGDIHKAWLHRLSKHLARGSGPTCSCSPGSWTRSARRPRNLRPTTRSPRRRTWSSSVFRPRDPPGPH